MTSKRKTKSKKVKSESTVYNDHGFAILNKHFSEIGVENPTIWKAWMEYSSHEMAQELEVEQLRSFLFGCFRECT